MAERIDKKDLPRRGSIHQNFSTCSASNAYFILQTTLFLFRFALYNLCALFELGSALFCISVANNVPSGLTRVRRSMDTFLEKVESL